jgi:predicted nucleotide-binding protein
VSKDFYSGPIFLHFLNRELLRSLDLKHVRNTETALRIILLSNVGALFSGLSLIWESSEYANRAFFLLSKSMEYQQLELISDSPTLNEFLSSRQELYKFDHERYPMYFEDQITLSIFKPTVYKQMSATKVLFSNIVSWGNRENSTISNFFNEDEAHVLNFVQDLILDKTLNKEEKAITISLYEPLLDSYSRSPTLKYVVSRFLSSLYLIHFRDYINGDICTGLPGLEYYDRFSKNFPLVDIRIFEFILSRIGYSTYLNSNREELIEFVLASRGGVKHSELSRLLHFLVSGVCFAAGLEGDKKYSLSFRNRVQAKLQEMIGDVTFVSVDESRIDDFLEVGIYNLNSLTKLCRRDRKFDLFAESSLYDEGVQAIDPYLVSRQAAVYKVGAMSSIDAKRVFIVYGRNTAAHNAMKLFLQALKLDPLDFEEVRNDLGGSPFVGDIVQEGMNRARAIVVLLTPDEYVALRPGLDSAHDPASEKKRWQARPNVLLEAGMALAIDERRTILVVLGNVHLSSDLHGRHFIHLDNSSRARDSLVNALIGVGCQVSRYIVDWNNPVVAGDFEKCLRPPALPRVKVSSPFN